MGIRIYSASAGSGKTFRLVVNYINILLENPENFKNILAVTFTNASTQEMKDRIISVLSGIVNSKTEEERNKIGEFEELCKLHSEMSKDEIIRKCKDALQKILHDYSMFTISTIDSFFQKVLKNMTKELDISSNLETVIADKTYNNKAIKQLIEKCEKDTDLRTWLNSYFKSRDDDKKSWNFERDLASLAKNLNKAIIMRNIDNTELDLANLEKVKNALEKVLKVESDLKKEMEALCKKHGLTDEDFCNKTRGGLYHSIRTKTGKEFFNKKLLNCKDKHGYILQNKKTIAAIDAFYDKASFEIDRIADEIATIEAYYKCIFLVGVLRYIFNEREMLLKDDNAFLLGNTKHLLAKMGLEEEDALFIYEKIGTYVKYMMIDEFQDTSKPDWTNFEVLVNNCLSSKAQSVFIYGDIKQSIYRWNDGDSQIMKDLITNGTNDVVPLKENHRTYGNIVTFNNELFTSLYYPKGTDVTQTAIKGKGKGCVRIQILPKKDNKMAERVWEEVAMYKEKGFEGKDIAILCRKKAQIAEMVKYLRSNGVEAISDTAFLFSSSDAVTKIVSAMKFLNNKDCEVSMEHAFGDYGDITEDVKKDKKAFKCEIKKKLCEKKINYKEMSTIELAIALASFLEVDEDTFFLPAFYDHIHNYMKRESTKWGDFLTYWDDTLCNQAVNNTYKDAIRVTTIHKSKGLQYPIVIVPYCNWGYESEFKNNKFWVENTTRRFAQPLIYATKNQLTDTDFNTEAEKERALEKEDAINTLYVAFTRPKYYLSVLSNIEVDDNNQPKLQTKEGKDIENVATKLYTYTHKTENKWEYEYGTIEDKKDTIGDKKEDEEEKKKTIEVDELDLSNNHPVFSRSKAARNYFFEDEKEKEEAANQKGTRFHNFMEEIIVEKDLEKVLKAWENRGKDTSNIKEVVEKMLAYAKEQKTQWFEGKYKVINERNINPKDEDKKNKDDSFYTIDRLMIGKDKVIVVDYKFTTINNNLAKYKEQVNNYRKLLNNMGYKNIECYLWYVDIIDSDNGIDINTEIIEVKEQ